MIRPEAVLRDLRAYRKIRRHQAPEAIDELARHGLVEVLTYGRVRLVEPLPPRKRGRGARAVAREDAVRARLTRGPATTAELARVAGGLTLPAVAVICRRIGAYRRLETVVVLAHGRPVRRCSAVWRLA